VIKVFAINGSPKMGKGNTAQVLNPFIEGMKEAGASVDLCYAKRLNVKPCTGTFYCWNQKPGQCIHQDDMQSIYALLRETEIFIFATPVYIPLPGEMQNFINRLCPIIDPILEIKEGRTRAKLRNEYKIRKLVLVSTSGWWEKGNFGTVLRIAKELAKDMSIEFAGALLRPHANLLGREPEKAKIVYESCRKAGIQLIKSGKIPEKLTRIVSKPLISYEKWIQE
jgi:multimeric flavodoxin WrbA